MSIGPLEPLTPAPGVEKNFDLDRFPIVFLLPVADGGGHYFGTVLRAPEELDNIIADSCVSAM